MIILREWGFESEGRASVPTRIDRRYCPTDSSHWEVADKRCRVCKAEIRTATYRLTEEGS